MKVTSLEASTTSGLTKQMVISRFIPLSSTWVDLRFRRQSWWILRQQWPRFSHNYSLSSSLHWILPRHPGRHGKNVPVAPSTSYRRGIQQSHQEEPCLDFLRVHVTYKEYLCWRTEVLFVFVEWRYGFEVWCAIAADCNGSVHCCVGYFIVDAWYRWICGIRYRYQRSECIFLEPEI